MVKVVLLDVNVLLALGWTQHQFHNLVRSWFLQRGARKWATCPFTEAGFVRLAAHPALRPGTTVPQCVETLRQLCSTRGHVFWPADFGIADEPLFEQLEGHRQTTDAYLLALAVRNNAMLATLDGGIKTMARSLLNDPDRVELIAENPAV